MRQSLIFSAALLMMCGSKVQQTPIARFIETFKTQPPSGIINFGTVIQDGDRMTKSEALKFLYYGDTLRLFCEEKIIDMENERNFAIVRNLYLPKKNFKVVTEKYNLIATTEYECKDVLHPMWLQLSLKIFDRNNRIKDSLVVQRSNDYDYQTTSIMNLDNNKIFLVQTRDDAHHIFLYSIDNEQLVFKKEKEQNNCLVVVDDLQITLKKVAWLNDFLN